MSNETQPAVEIIDGQVKLAVPGTTVSLSADSPMWHCEAFEEGMTMSFQFRTRVRVMRLTFNGREMWDWRPIVQLKPITAAVRQIQNMPEWEERL